MQALRLFPRFARLLLALSLVLSPTLSALNGGTAVAATRTATAQGMQTGGGHRHQHAAQPVEGQPDQANSGCAQHDACFGQCCPACAHCAGALLSAFVVALTQQPVLAPREPLPLSRAFVTPRERPPRSLCI